jgi:hypothetical protein
LTFTDNGDVTVFVVVVALRLVVPLFIPRYPLPAIVLALIIDGIDQTVFQWFGYDPPGYQGYDKALDVYYLTIAYASTIRNWGGSYGFVLARALWYYRLVGVVLFEYVGARWLLLVFPNTFEYFFIAIEVVKVSWNPFDLTRRQVTILAATIWVGIKLPQEWWLHVAQLDFTDVVKEHVFGVGVHDSWVHALSHRPWAFMLLVAVVALAVTGARMIVTRIPRRDWPATFSADVQGNHLGWARPPDEVVPAAFFGWAFAEKAILVTLVTMIFGQILPGRNRGVLQVALSTTLIIAVSTLVSQALARRGVTWRSTAGELVVMGAANVGIAFGVAALVPGAGRSAPLGTFLFLVSLLTLIVGLFDQFKLIDRGPGRRNWMRRSRRPIAGSAA